MARQLHPSAGRPRGRARQRMNTHAVAWFDLANAINEALLSCRIQGQGIDFGSLSCGYTPLDIDTFSMDNSDTKKELVGLVGRTHAGVDGYCPIASYLGTAGFCLELALPPGVQHLAARASTTCSACCPWLPVWSRLPFWCGRTRSFAPLP